MTGTNP